MRSFTPTLCLLLALVLCTLDNTEAQSFERGLQLYSQEQYEEAIERFLELEQDERASLFTGKSYLALGDYQNADRYLKRAAESNIERISSEANYSLAIKDFHLKNFTRSLERLHRLANESRQPDLQSESSSLYDQLIRFLTARQRHDVFWQTDNVQLQIDLVRSAAEGVDPEMALTMLQILERTDDANISVNQLRNIRQTISRRPVSERSAPYGYPAPAGIVYNIGVALPSFSPDDPNMVVSRNLYSGLLFASEEFNARHANKKVFLTYRDTHSNADSTAKAMHELIWTDRADVVVGPLFSDMAVVLSRLANRYQVPILTPLANSDQINEGHLYTFQLNPTFSVHGRQMARFAVRELRLDTVAVISQKNALGHSSAMAFRSEAERLGAHVAYHIEEDFAEHGYDLSEITEIFTQDPVLIDSLQITPVDGIYAPFTGQEAGTLVNLLMTDLEAMNSDLVLMGSEEWGNVRYSDAQLRNFSIYHTRSYSTEPTGEEEEHFSEDFENRFGFEPDTFARIGYDAGGVLLRALESAGNPAVLNQALRDAPLYRGLAMDILFDGTQINRLAQIEPVTERARSRIE